MKRILVLIGLFALLTTVAYAQVEEEEEEQGQSCCAVTAIDASTGIVTAQVKATGKAFQFKASPSELRSLKVGSKVFANFKSNQVSLDGKRACCRLSAARIQTAQPNAAAARPAASAATTSAVQQPQPAQPTGVTGSAATSADGADEPDEADPEDPDEAPMKVDRSHSPALAKLSKERASFGSGSKLVKLSDHPNRQSIIAEVMRGLKDREIDIGLLKGEKYMINKCLGVKAAAGTFRMKLENPDLRLEGGGAVLRFNVPRVAMDVLKIRIRPNATNILKPCKFSKKRKVGGSARDVRMTMRFDPALDVQQCRLGSVGNVHTTWRIGNLNLKPLQNDLDKMAKNMIEDSLTYAANNLNVMDRIIAAFNGAIGAQCKQTAASTR